MFSFNCFQIQTIFLMTWTAFALAKGMFILIIKRFCCWILFSFFFLISWYCYYPNNWVNDSGDWYNVLTHWNHEGFLIRRFIWFVFLFCRLLNKLNVYWYHDMCICGIWNYMPFLGSLSFLFFFKPSNSTSLTLFVDSCTNYITEWGKF